MKTVQELVVREASLYQEWTARVPNVVELGTYFYSKLMDELEDKAKTFKDIPRRFGHVTLHMHFGALDVRVADWLDPDALVVGRLQ